MYVCVRVCVCACAIPLAPCCHSGSELAICSSLLHVSVCAAMAKPKAATVSESEYESEYTYEDEEVESVPVAPGRADRKTKEQKPVASGRRAEQPQVSRGRGERSASQRAAAPERRAEQPQVARGRSEKSASQRATASERSAKSASRKPTASERTAEQQRVAGGRSEKGASQRAAAPERSASSASQRSAASERQGKRLRKSEVPPLQGDRLTRRVERVCEAFAQMLPGEKKGRLLLAAAQKHHCVMANADAECLDDFEKAFFHHGDEMEALKESLAMLFETRDKFADRSERLSEEDAAVCLVEFADRWLGPVSGGRRRSVMWAALRRELGGKARITEVLKIGASWAVHDNTGKDLLHAIVNDIILRTERTLAENVQKRAKEQTAARRAAAAKPVAATRKPDGAVASRRGKTHTGRIPPWRRASANDGIGGMTQEDQTEGLPTPSSMISFCAPSRPWLRMSRSEQRIRRQRGALWPRS